MSTGYLYQQKCWQYMCDFGCWDYGYESEIQAADAEAAHDCEFPRLAS